MPSSSSSSDNNKKISPMQKRQDQPGPVPIDKKHEKYDNKRHEFSFLEGLMDDNRLALYNDDYYGMMGSLGFYDASHMPWYGPLTHDTDTTTALHYYDTSMKKTPIDKRIDVINPNLSQVQQDYTNADLYDVQDFAEASSKRIKEKTHRILNDPTRKFQSQKLINIQNIKGELLNPRKRISSLDKLVAYNAMVLDVNTLLLERLTDVLDYQEKAYMFNKYETKPLSQNFYAEMTLTDGAQATKLDFTDSSNNRNVPATATLLDFPKHNLLSLQIIFDSGTNLFFATNKSTNSLETTVKMTSPPQQYTITPGQFSIKSVNLRASGANGVVRLIGLY